MSEKHDPEATGRYLADLRADLQRMRSSPPPAAPVSDVPSRDLPSRDLPSRDLPSRDLPITSSSGAIANPQALAASVFALLGNDADALREFSAALAKLLLARGD